MPLTRDEAQHGDRSFCVHSRTTSGVAVMRIEAPETRNGYTLGGLKTLADVIRAADEADDVRALVVCGSAGVFCLGASPPLLLALGELPFQERVSVLQAGQDVIRAVLTSSKLTVAYVNGLAAGTGVDLMLACDRAYVSGSARVTLFFSKLGLLPDAGSLYFLAERFGARWAQRVAETSPLWNAERCVALELADDACEEPLEAIDWAERLRSELALPDGTRAALKACAWADRRASIEAHWQSVAQLQAGLLGQARVKAMIRRVAAVQAGRLSSPSPNGGPE